MELGEIVYSKAGRDKKSYYVIVEIVGEGFVKIADGRVRKISNPKLKNVKHVKKIGVVLERIKAKLEKGTKVFNPELYSALREYNEKK